MLVRVDSHIVSSAIHFAACIHIFVCLTHNRRHAHFLPLHSCTVGRRGTTESLGTLKAFYGIALTPMLFMKLLLLYMLSDVTWAGALGGGG